MWREQLVRFASRCHLLGHFSKAMVHELGRLLGTTLLQVEGEGLTSRLSEPTCVPLEANLGGVLVVLDPQP